MRAPRWVHRAYAAFRGHFWLPCPACGQPFGGHEIREVHGHKASRPADDFTMEAICPRCTARGVGCVAWAKEGEHHECCPYAPIPLP